MCWMCEEDALYRAYLERAEAAKSRSAPGLAVEADGSAQPAPARASEKRAKSDVGE